MADYKELVKMLRLEVECDRRIYPQGLPSKYILISAAADAIEELEAAVNKLLHITNDLETEVDHLERERRWIPVGERLPEEDDDAIIYAEWTGASGTKYKDIILSDTKTLLHMGYKPIAWMPLPKPPEEDA